MAEECFPDHDPEELEEIRDDFLLDLHLIQHEVKGTYRLHELIREFLHSKLVELKQTDNLNQAIALTIAAIAQRFPFDLTLRELHGVQTPLVYVRAPIQPGSAITPQIKTSP